MLATYGFYGLLAVGIIDGLNALRSSDENAARSWAIAMVLLPYIGGAIATLVLFGATAITGVADSLPTAIWVHAPLIPAWPLLFYLAKAWRRTLSADASQRVSLPRVLFQSSGHPHRVLAVGLVAFLAFPVAGVVSFTLRGSSIPATEELDPTGLALQEAALADGTVTLGEFEAAVAGMASCMEQRGVSVRGWSIPAEGGWSFSWFSNDEARAETVHNICYYGYVNDVEPVAGR